MNPKTKILIAVVLLFLFTRLLAETNFSELLTSVKQIGLPFLVVLLVLQMVTEGLLVFQWCRLAKLMGLTAPFSLMLFINAKVVIMEAITPGAKMGGEALRTVLLAQRLDYTTNQATALLTIQKIISVGALVCINLLFVLFLANSNPFFSNKFSRLGLLAILLLLLTVFSVLLFRGQWLIQVMARGKWQGKWYLSIRNWLGEFAAYAQTVREQRWQLLLQFLLALFIWALFPAKLVLLVSPFGIRLSYLQLVATTLASYFVAMIAIFPGGLGSFEVVMSSMLMSFGLTAEQGLTVALSFRFITFWFVGLVSVVLAVWDSWRRAYPGCQFMGRSGSYE